MIFERILGIAACDSRGVIGKNGKLPWHYPEDLKHFSDTILGSPIIMGYRTFLSLPVRYFEGRVTIVFTRSPGLKSKYISHMQEGFVNATNLTERGINFVSSFTEFFALEESFKNLYVIGGAQIYNLFLKENLIKEFILTRLKSLHEGDAFFPLSLLTGWSSLTVLETTTLSIHRYLEPTHAYKNI